MRHLIKHLVGITFQIKTYNHFQHVNTSNKPLNQPITHPFHKQDIYKTLSQLKHQPPMKGVSKLHIHDFLIISNF